MRVSVEKWQIGAAVLLTMALASWPAAVPRAAEDPATPASSIARLRSGNAIFVSTPEAALPITASRRSLLAGSQAPFAAVLSCADSRVPPEVVFHTGLGDLFVVRAAGHVTDRSVLASLEYAAEHLHVPVIVVMGHEACGAVKAAAETPASKSLGPNLDYMLKAIRPAVAATSSAPDAVRSRAAILKNVEDSINDLVSESAILRHMAESGKLGMVGAFYELSTGRAYFSEPAVVGPGAAAAPRPAMTASEHH